MSAILPAEVPTDLRDRIAELGGDPSLNLYRILANSPALLSAWIEFAYSLRQKCTLPRALRELMILRGAHIAKSQYEWAHHQVMAKAAGVPDEKIAQVRDWRNSDAYDPRERVCLELMEVLTSGGAVEGALEASIGELFSTAERIELVLTASFYVMVPRVLKSLHVDVEKHLSIAIPASF